MNVDYRSDRHSGFWLPASGFFIPDIEGNYVIQLTVYDELYNSEPDTVVITAEKPSEFAPCDLDKDGVVDSEDRDIFLSAYDSCEGDSNYLPEVDYDGDGCITLNDYREWYRCHNEFVGGH